MECLTPRERDILADVSEGMTDKEIALRRHISLGTVKNYLISARRKLGARTRVELALRAQADERERLRRWREHELTRLAAHERAQRDLLEQVHSLRREIGRLSKRGRGTDGHNGDRYPHRVLD